MIFLVIGKMPLEGLSKTRLAKTVGEQAAIQLYQAMINDFFLKLSTEIRPDQKLYFAYTPNCEQTRCYFDEIFNSLGINARLLPQPETAFFSRITFCLEQIELENGPQTVHLTGTDIPDFPFDLLPGSIGPHELYIGPDRDGGFYYCGLNTQNRAVLDIDQLVRDGERNVFETLKKKAELISLKTEVLLSWSDIDTRDDLEEFFDRVGGSDTYETAKIWSELSRK